MIIGVFVDADYFEGEVLLLRFVFKKASSKNANISSRYHSHVGKTLNRFPSKIPTLAYYLRLQLGI